MSLVNQYSDVICAYYAALKPSARVNRIKKLDESALNILLNILAEKNVSREDLKTVRDGLKRVEKRSFTMRIKPKSAAVQGQKNLLKALYFCSHTPQLVKDITRKVIKVYMEIVITERVSQLDPIKLLLGQLKKENLEVNLSLFDHIDTTPRDLRRIHLNPKILPLLVNIRSAVIIPQHLAVLKSRDKIEKLTLKYGEVDKVTLKLLESLTNLQFLTFERCQFESDVWEMVKMLKPTPQIIHPYFS